MCSIQEHATQSCSILGARSNQGNMVLAKYYFSFLRLYMANKDLDKDHINNHVEFHVYLICMLLIWVYKMLSCGSFYVRIRKIFSKPLA